MRKIIFLFRVAAFIWAVVPMTRATAINGNIYTEFYSFKTEDPGSQSHLRSLQGFRFNVKDALTPGLSFFGRGRFASDISTKFGTDPDFRVFGAYIQYLSKNRIVLAKAGRQFTYEGLGGFTMDGVKLRVKYQKLFSVTGYAGTLPGPSFFTYDEINGWDDYNVMGGKISINTAKKMKFNVSFMQKQYNKETDAQLAGVDFSYRKGNFRESARVDYDLQLKRTKLVNYRSRYRCSKGHSIALEYRYSQPTFRLSNFFSTVKSKPYHQVRLSPTYKVSPDFNAYSSISFTKFKDENNIRLKLGGIYKGQSGGVVFSDGNGGVKIGVYTAISRQTSEKLSLYARADMFSYKLDSDEDDYESSVATALGARYELVDNLTSRGEFQVLNNAGFNYDMRFYLRLDYNFYSKTKSEIFGGGGVR